jgi:FHS family L-fucose permease-like MFS transporter
MKKEYVTHLSIFKQMRNAFKRPQLVLGVITLMLYLSAEVLAGDSIGGFGKELGVYGTRRKFLFKVNFFHNVGNGGGVYFRNHIDS